MVHLKFTSQRNMLVLLLALLSFLGRAQNAALQGGKPLGSKQLDEVMGNANKILFVENKGQWPANIIYKADVPGWQLQATPQGMLIGKFDPASVAAMSAYNAQVEDMMVRRARGQKVQMPGAAPAMKGHGWRINFAGGKIASAQTIITNGKSADYMNYFSGNSTGNAQGAYSYNEITYTDVYPGISVKYYTAAQGMENDIIVKPGADASLIKMQIEGIEDLKMNANGDLILPTSVGEVPISSPVSYLLDDKGNKTSVKLKYHLTGKNTVGFEIPAYDKTQTLVIDPIVMRWATWVSGSTSQDGHCHGIDLDANGNIYVTGRIGTGLITVGAFQNTNPGSGDDMFIGKYTEPAAPGGAGTRVWQTYIGGTGTTNPYAITVGPDGYVYVAGLVQDNLSTTYGTGAPATNWTNRTQVFGNFSGQQCFVAKLPESGAWATVREIGTVSEDLGPTLFDLRVVPTTGNNFDLVAVGTVAQQANSGADGDIPAATYTNGTVAPVIGGNTNGYTFQISNDLSTLRWSKQYTGGSGGDGFNVAVVDNAGNIYTAGTTNSAANISYNNPSAQSSLTGGSDGWLMSLSSANGTANWSRYFNSGAGLSTDILCMELNQARNKLIIGGTTTGLSASNITTLTPNRGNGDFFVANLPITGASTNWGTYFGGTQNEYNMMGLNVDQNDDVYALGYTFSRDIAVVSNPIEDGNYNPNTGDRQAVFFKLSGTNGATVLYTTYLGGSGDDYDPVGEKGLKFNNCRIYLAITSASDDFPLTAGTLTSTVQPGGIGTLEPIVMSMANPPDITGNNISSGGSQVITCGATPAPIVATTPTYVIPAIIRNTVTETNGTVNAYPDGVPSITSFQWQASYDSGQSWTNIAGATGASLNFTGPIGFTGLIEYRRIINGDACNRIGDTLDVAFILNGTTHPAPTATTDAPICSGETLTLNGSSTDTGTLIYVWNGPNGIVDSVQNVSIPNASTADTGLWTVYTINSQHCASVRDSIYVSIGGHLAAPSVTANSPVCAGDTIKLSASGTGTVFNWSGPNGFTATSATVAIPAASVANAGSYSVTQADANGTCTSAPTAVSVVVDTLPLVYAGPRQEQCNNGTFTLNAYPAINNGVWRINSGSGVLNNNTNYNATLSGVPAGTKTVLQWTVTNGGCSASSTVTLKNDAPPVVANAGPEQINCTNSTFMLMGNNPAPGTGVWSIVSGTGTILNPNSPNTQVLGVPVNDTINDTTVVQWTISSGVCPSSSSQTLLIRPSLPIAICKDITVALVNGVAIVTDSMINGNSYSGCGTLVLSTKTDTFTCANIGPHQITLVVTDGLKHYDSCTATVTIIDTTAPTAICKNITVALVNGAATITAAQIDGGSSASCGAVNLSASPTSFNCANIGPNNVTLTVTDNFGNVSSCNAVVTVIDTTPPTAVCQNISVALNNGTASITASQIDGGSSAACGAVTLSATPTNFTCSNIGANNVTLTVTDAYGNTSTCTAVVTVTDTATQPYFTSTPPSTPVAVGQLFTYSITASGPAGASLVFGSTGLATWLTLTDNGNGTATLTGTPGTGNVGVNTVTITLSEGTYTCAVPVTQTFIINVYEAELGVGLQGINSCGLADNGAANTIVAGGTGPFIYMWSGSGNGATNVGDSTGSSITGLAPGTYSVTVTDFYGITASASVIITSTAPNITATGDTSICIGASVQLGASGGDLYSWSPGSSLNDSTIANPIATPTVTTTYTVTGYVHTGNLVYNGDFSLGNTGFTSDYTYISAIANANTPGGDQGLVPEGNYAVDTNAHTYHPGFFGHDHTSGHGNFMIVNGAPVANEIIWSQTVPNIQPNSTYYFSTWVSSIDLAGNYADLVFYINGVQLGAPILAPADTGDWIQFYTTWNSGNNTSADISIINENIIREGNDFGLDDISFTTACPSTAQVTVNVYPIPSATAGPSQTICLGQSATLTATGNGSYKWSTGDTTASINVSPAVNTTYTVTVTNPGNCSASANATVSISNSLPTAVCQNTTIILGADNTAAITAADVDGGSSALCGVAAITVTPNTFNCANIGNNQVTLTVTDSSGHSSSCTAVVTVRDTTAPTAICKNITVALVNGTASITAAQIDGGSSASCGGVTLSATPSSFTCSNLGPNNVTLTVTDAYGNTSNCTAVVTVIDTASQPAFTSYPTNTIIEVGQNFSYNITTVSAAGTTTVISSTTLPGWLSLTNTGNGTATLSGTPSSTDIGYDTITLSAGEGSYTCQGPVTQTFIIQVIAGNLVVTIQGVNTCGSTDNGAASVFVTGGTQPYLYAWSSSGPGATNVSDFSGSSITNLAVGTYTVTVTDAYGLSQTASVTIVPTTPNITVSNDTTICIGSSVQLLASGGDLYSWSPASSLNDSAIANPIATPTVTTTYTVTGYVHTGNLVVNGDFSQGNFGFTSGYNYVSPADNAASTNGDQGLYPETTYAVDTNAHNYHPDFFGHDHTSGSGNFMIINGATTPNVAIWSETVNNILPNTTYYFSTWISAMNTIPVYANLQFTINGQQIGPVISSPDTIDKWIQFYTTWNSGSNTSANISIVNENTIADGNDFGLDDISFTTACPSTAQVTVTVVPIPVASAGPDQTICAGRSATLTASGGSSYTWSTGDTSTTITVTPGATTTYTVTAYNNGNCSATASVTVNISNSTPTAVCQNTTVILDATGNASITAANVDGGSSAACGLASVSVSPNTFNCSNLGVNQVTLTVTDSSGHTASCNATVTVLDTTPPTAICKNITVVLSNGSASITGSDIDGGSSALCGNVTLSANPSTFTCANLGANNVTLTVTDGSGNTAYCTAVVTVIDTTKPTAVCKNITVALNQGAASITASQIDGGSTADCGGPVKDSASQTSFNCSNLGANNVTLTVTDASGNQSSCVAVVTVIDTTPPTAICKNITIALVGSTANISASQIDGGSSASCGGVTLSASPTNFNCSNLGANNVTLTVTDGSGNTAQCTAVVTVIDNTPPVAVCKNDTLYLNAQGSASLTAAQVDGGSTDNCTIVSRTVSKSSFNCSNIGTTPVTLTVTDESGNVDSCHAKVTILDTIKPVAVCKSITVTLINGVATITAAQIDGGSTDNCGIVSTTASQTTFTVANVGANSVTLTVTDASGNKSTCTATVTVINPSISCNVTATSTSIHTNGTTTLTVSSTGVAPFTYHWSPGTNLSCTNCKSPVFTPTASGTYTFDVTVTDHNGATSTCSITISVTPPPITCNVTASHSTCQQHSSTTLNVTSTGVAPFTYHWSPGTDLSCTNCANPVFTPSLPGNYTFDVTVTDHNGSTTTCNITITVPAPPITCSAGANRTTIYLGYGPQTANLSVTATGTAPFTYRWSPANQLNCSICNNPVFAPTSGGQYTFDVTVTDTYGSSTTCDVSICVLDIRVNSAAGHQCSSSCGSNCSSSPQVYICEGSSNSCGHSTETTVAMDSNSVSSYMSSHPGSQLGSCGQSCNGYREDEVLQLLVANQAIPFDVLLYPNPFSAQFHVQVRSESTAQIAVRMRDLSGKVVSEKLDAQPGDEMKLGSDLAPGIYLVEITQNDVTKVIKMIKQSTY